MKVTVSMSVVSLKLVTIVCLCCTVLTDAEIEGVVWKKIGEEITIQCKSQNAPEYLYLKMGLDKEDDIFGKENHSNKITVSERFQERLVPNGDFPNVDILIRNLTSKDTGPYWCVYKTFNKETKDLKEVGGTGSVLLVVTGSRGSAGACPSCQNVEMSPKIKVDSRTSTDAVHGCDSSHQKLVLVSVVIAAAVLLGIIMGFLIWIILKTKHLRTTVKPRHVATNDVYEDMRGTLRR